MLPRGFELVISSSNTMLITSNTKIWLLTLWIFIIMIWLEHYSSVKVAVMPYFHFHFVTGSLVMDQICSRRMRRKHYDWTVEGLCLENIKQWQGRETSLLHLQFSWFVIVLQTLCRISHCQKFCVSLNCKQIGLLSFLIRGINWMIKRMELENPTMICSESER